MLDQLKAMLPDGAEVSVFVKAVKGGLDIVVMPKSGFPEGWEDEVKDEGERIVQGLRAALAQSVSVSVQGERLNDAFGEAIAEFAGRRSEAQSALEDLQALGASLAKSTAAAKDYAANKKAAKGTEKGAEKAKPGKAALPAPVAAAAPETQTSDEEPAEKAPASCNLFDE